MKNSLLDGLLSQAKKNEIGFGIHENCVILSVANDVRKNKDNEVIKRNCFTVFAKKNAAGEITAEKEISWFNIDPTSEYAYDNFFSQLEQLTAIVDTLRDPAEDEKDIWDLAFEAILTENEIEFTKDALEKAIKTKKVSNEIVQAIGDTYVELLKPLVGKSSAAMRLKIVYDSNGKYLQQPKYNSFVETMEVDLEDSKLKLTDNDNANKVKSTTGNTSSGVKQKLNSPL